MRSFNRCSCDEVSRLNFNRKISKEVLEERSNQRKNTATCKTPNADNSDAIKILKGQHNQVATCRTAACK